MKRCVLNLFVCPRVCDKVAFEKSSEDRQLRISFGAAAGSGGGSVLAMYTLDFAVAKIPVCDDALLLLVNNEDCHLTMLDVVVESICIWDLEEQEGEDNGECGGCDLVVGRRALAEGFSLKQFCVCSSRIRHVTLGAECFAKNIALEKFHLPRCVPGGSFHAGRRAFSGCTCLSEVRLGSADGSSSISLDAGDLFGGCTALERLLLLGNGFSSVALGGGGGGKNLKAVYLCDQYLDAVDMSLLDAGEFTEQIAHWKRKYHELQDLHKTHPSHMPYPHSTHPLNPTPHAILPLNPTPHAPKHHHRKKKGEKEAVKKREKQKHHPRDHRHDHRHRRRRHHHQRREIVDRRSESTPSMWDKMLKAILQKWLPMK